MSDLVAASNDNYQRAFVRLATNVPDGETSEFGSLTAVASGLPSPFFNRIFVFEPPLRDVFATAVAWLADHDVPFWVTVAEPILTDVADFAADVGLVRTDESNPGMVQESLDHLPRNRSDADITEVTAFEELDEFVTVAAAVFGMPEVVTETVYEAALVAEGTTCSSVTWTAEPSLADS